MKKVLFAVTFLVMLFGMIAIGNAEREDWHGGIRKRVHEAKQSIERGIEHGTLTRDESRKLTRELDRILDKIDRMKRDGHLSEREREKINDDLDKLERDIRREKHDDDTRHGGDYRGRAERILCESHNERRQFCPINTHNRYVRVVRQLSSSSCRQNRTWGYDSRGIWVDRGCRAEFEVIREGHR